MGLYVGYELQQLYIRPLGLSEDAVVEVVPGKGIQSIMDELQAKGARFNSLRSKIFIKYKGYDKKLKAGEYAIKKTCTEDELYKILISGHSIEYSTVVPEGTNVFELADILENKKLAKREKFLQLVFDHDFVRETLGKPYDSLEGYLFPDTYFFTKFDGEKKIIKTMLNRFKQYVGNIIEQNGGLTSHQIVTLASIIEKETGAPEERPLISSVFKNRLQKNMRLQTDPTIIYAHFLDSSGQRLENIKKSHLIKKHPYNTYHIFGLPPGPIANPGLAAIKAAVRPEQSNYLFFVSKNNGTHVFTSNYKDHAKAVNQLQRRK